MLSARSSSRKGPRFTIAIAVIEALNVASTPSLVAPHLFRASAVACVRGFHSLKQDFCYDNSVLTSFPVPAKLGTREARATDEAESQSPAWT